MLMAKLQGNEVIWKQPSYKVVLRAHLIIKPVELRSLAIWGIVGTKDSETVWCTVSFCLQ
jgi:hypothetical protein